MVNSKVFQYLGANWRLIAFFATPLLLLPLPILDPTDRGRCAFMVLLMCVYWLLEVLPLAVTGLIPVALCPIMGIMGTNNVSMLYMKGTCMLFVGGKK